MQENTDLSQMRVEETKTYAFRDPETGVIVRLAISSNDGGDCCGEETCRLSLNSNLDDIFEVKSLRDIAIVMKNNEQWYNSSRTRPMWNGLNPAELELVCIKRKKVFSSPHGDSIEETKLIETVEFPGFADCERLGARSLPAPLIRRYFGVSISPEALYDVEFALVCFDQPPVSDDVIGRFATPGRSLGNTGIIEMIIDLPDGYLIKGTALDREKEGKHLMVALLNIGDKPLNLERVPQSVPQP